MPSSKVLITLDASDAGLHFLSAVEDSKVSWSAFVRWAEGDGVFALFLSPNASIPIPKRALTAEQQAEFREILGRNIVAK